MDERRWIHRLPLWVAYSFLYLPILVLFAMSFNASGLPTVWGGFTTEWYGAMLTNEVILGGAATTLLIAAGSTVVATVLGTALALGLERYNRSRVLDAAVMAPAILPDIVLAFSLLAFYTLIGFSLGRVSVMAAHVTFNMAFVASIVRTRLHNFDRSVEEAALDLGATELRTFRRVTLPIIAPGIMAGALLSFTLSIDEFVIAFFTNGPANPTLPVVIYSMVRFGVTPEVNALAVVLLATSFSVILIAQRLGGLRGVVS
jgi:spermidine/putrescine transport system permease protein